MRALRIAIALVAIVACKSKTDGTSSGGSSEPAPQKLDLVRVDDDHAVVQLATLRKPLGVAWIDAAGAIAVAKSDDKWPAFPTGTRQPVPDPEQLYAAFLGDIDAKLAKQTADDPPPPPEDDRPDDGSAESGGTGTALAIDEGKMGKVDSDRAEGQYKMTKPPEDPALARQQAIEQARAAGILGSTALNHPAFQVVTTATATPVAKLDFDPVVIAPAPGAPAATVVVALSRVNGGSIAVDRGGKLVALAFGYRHEHDQAVIYATPPPWLELHLAPDGIHVIEPTKAEQTTIAWKGSTVDRDALRDVFTKLRSAGPPDVDVLVARAGVTAQQLVDVLLALDSVGAKRRGLGVLQTSTDERLAALERAMAPAISIAQPAVTGDLDKTLIRKAIKQNLEKIKFCYEKRLLALPKLEGTVQAQFAIQPNGKVAHVVASGLDPEVASCVAKVIETITFDKPKGGVVNVSYPFTFRSADR